jgi:hypothetical protein
MTKLAAVLSSLSFLLITTQVLQASAPTHAYASGEDLVDRVVCRTDEIFYDSSLPPAAQFLKRIAKAESDYGRHLGTYRSGYYGGIWQVDRIGFKETQDTLSHPVLIDLHRTLREKGAPLGQKPLNWTTIIWQACVVPEISCIAARLFLAIIPSPIPRSLRGQAHYWKKYYNTYVGSGRIDDFVRHNSGQQEVVCLP